MIRPMISVIIPNYNYAQFLYECINSALVQSYRDFEVIVVDDGSTDDSVEVVRRFDDAVKLICQPNKGQAAARNTGMRAARGQWVALLDSDDLWYPNKLKVQLIALEQNPSWWFIGSKSFHDNVPECSETIRCSPLELKYFMVDSMAPSGTLIRKDCFEKIGYFNEDHSIRGVEDKEMWLRLASRFQGGMVHCRLFRYRQHPAQQNRKIAQIIAGDRKVLQSFFMTNPYHSRLYWLAKAHFLYTSAISLRDNGQDPRRALLYFLLSFLYYPFSYSEKITAWIRMKSSLVSIIQLISLGNSHKGY